MSASVHRPRGARGTRALALAAVALLAACHDPTAVADRADASLDRASRDAAPALATVAWNEVARELIVKHGTSAPASIRTFALLGVAQHDAVVAAERAPHTRGPLRPSDRGAVAGASAAVLAYAYPQSAAFLDGLVAAERAAPRPPNRKHDDVAAGEAIGRAVAAPLVERARTDGYHAPFTGTVPVCPGCWLPTTPPAFAMLGQARPYLLASTAQFRPTPPPAFGSPAFDAALAEVRQIADTRTSVQDSIAKYWALPVGTIGAQGYFNRLASELIVRHHRSEREAAHVIALLNIAAHDALLASHEAKYHYWLIRPSQADPGIVRAIGLPSFPAYPSNHSALAAATATVLGRFFPSERARLDAMAEEAALSRLYGGIHYRFDVDAGLTLGRQVGAWTLQHDPGGHRPLAPRLVPAGG